MVMGSVSHRPGMSLRRLAPCMAAAWDRFFAWFSFDSLLFVVDSFYHLPPRWQRERLSERSRRGPRADIFVLGPKSWRKLTWLGGVRFTSPTDMEVDLIVV